MPNRSLLGFDAADTPIVFDPTGPSLGLAEEARRVMPDAEHGIRGIQAATDDTSTEGWARDCRVAFVNAAP